MNMPIHTGQIFLKTWKSWHNELSIILQTFDHSHLKGINSMANGRLGRTKKKQINITPDFYNGFGIDI